MGAGWSTQDTATVAGLGASVLVTAIILIIIIYQFARFRKQQKKKAEEEELKKDRSWQTISREVPYRLGEDVFPSTYPDYPEYLDYPIDYPAEYPVDYPEPPRARFFPVEDTPYPMRPCIQQPVIFDCDCEPEPQPEHHIIFEPVSPQLPPPPLPPQPIVVCQPLPRESVPPPQREIIREIYFPSQPQPLPPPPPRERRGSWCGPSTDDWVLVKKEVKKKPKRRTKRVEDSDDDSDDDSASSSSSDEEAVSPYNRRLMPYDLAMPRVQFPQMPMQPIFFVPQQPAPAAAAPVPAAAPAPVPLRVYYQILMPYDLATPRMQFPQMPVQPIYFVPQQPCPAPAPASAPASAPVPVPVPHVQRNAFFAANVRCFDSRQYEEQEQRANVVTESYDCDECNF